MVNGPDDAPVGVPRSFGIVGTKGADNRRTTAGEVPNLGPSVSHFNRLGLVLPVRHRVRPHVELLVRARSGFERVTNPACVGPRPGLAFALMMRGPDDEELTPGALSLSAETTPRLLAQIGRASGRERVLMPV